MSYLDLLKYSFKTHREMAECPPDTRLGYLSESIFEFTTYDSRMDELFAKKAIEVCEAITNRETFDYMDSKEGEVWYLLMCNMPFFAQRIEWGTSIRGAWWSGPPGKPITLNSSGLWSGNAQLPTLVFSTLEWSDFIHAVIEFAKPEVAVAKTIEVRLNES